MSKTPQKYTVEYKGRGKGFAWTWKIVEATSKKEAKEKVWDLVAQGDPSFNGITYGKVELL